MNLIDQDAADAMTRMACSAPTIDLDEIPGRPQVLMDLGHRCLAERDPVFKAQTTLAVAGKLATGAVVLDASDRAPPPATPGRPSKPRLVAPRQLPARGLGTVPGRAAFLHAIAHIEFNAINLAWDAVCRFRGLPAAFHHDWVQVAADEARHFMMLRDRLQYLGFDYGDFDAHDGLWQMAQATADSCLRRMALVPRVLEARGLDVTPSMIERLRRVGDSGSAEVLEVILHEEIAHVAVGSRWFHWCCAQEGLDPEDTFVELVRSHARGALRGPFNETARLDAGFSVAELRRLDALAGPS